VSKRPRQLLLSPDFCVRLEHGGAIRKGKRKLARPIDPRRPMHLVMRAEVARNRLSLLCHARAIEALAHRLARRNRLKIRRFDNVGNHIHAIVQSKDRKGLQDFLRVFAGKTAQLVTGAKKGRAFGKFWDALAYTRVSPWGRAYQHLKSYLLINEIEAAGIFGFRRLSKL
jgi:REP element-mobilizing transposase RayT